MIPLRDPHGMSSHVKVVVVVPDAKALRFVGAPVGTVG